MSDSVFADTKKKQIGGDTLGGLLGITSRRVQQLAASGEIPKSSHGHYPYPESITAYCEYLRRLNKQATKQEQLKERELELKCEKLELQLQRREEDIRQEQAQIEWDSIIVMLHDVQQAIDEIDLTDEQRTTIREAVYDAMEARDAEARA